MSPGERKRQQRAVDDWMLAHREEIAAQIARGVEQAQRGELLDKDEVLEMLRKRRPERRFPRSNQ